MSRDGRLEPLKVRSGNYKLFFLGQAGSGGHPDSRLKLVAHQLLSKRIEVMGARRASTAWWCWVHGKAGRHESLYASVQQHCLQSSKRPLKPNQAPHF